MHNPAYIEQATTPPEPVERPHSERFADAMDAIETTAPLSVWAGLLAEIITERGTAHHWRLTSGDPVASADERSRQDDACNLRRALNLCDAATAGRILCRWYRQGTDEIAAQIADGDREDL